MNTNGVKNEKPTNSGNASESHDFWVECNVCKTQLKNWTGSTPCCGSIAWMVEDGKPTKKLSLFASVGGEPFCSLAYVPHSINLILTENTVLLAIPC